MKFIIDDNSHSLTIEGITDEQRAALAALLGPGETINCAKPPAREYVDLSGLHPAQEFDWLRNESAVRVHAVWHNDVTVGPGVRSVIQLQGCPIRCAGCYVPETHATAQGRLLNTAGAAQAWLEGGRKRDGVTILGGEPFAQPHALYFLLGMARERKEHIVVYTGYKVEWLRRLFPNHLRRMHMLIDGPYRKDQADGAGEWRGSTNQRIIQDPGRLADDVELSVDSLVVG